MLPTIYAARRKYEEMVVGEGNTILMQDGASPHTARVTKEAHEEMGT